MSLTYLNEFNKVFRIISTWVSLSISTPKIFISLKSAIMWIIWSLTKVPFFILVFIKDLRANCVVSLPSHQTSLIDLRESHKYNTMGLLIHSLPLGMSTFLFLRGKLFGNGRSNLWVTHFNCSIMSTVSKFFSNQHNSF